MKGLKCILYTNFLSICQIQFLKYFLGGENNRSEKENVRYIHADNQYYCDALEP